MKFKKSLTLINLIICLMLLLCKGLLDYGYKLLNLMYGSPYVYEFSGIKLFFSWILLIITFPLILKIISSPRSSSMVLTLIYIIGYVPGLSLFAFLPSATYDFIVLYFFYWILLMFSQCKMALIYCRFPKRSICKSMTIALGLIFVITVFFISWKNTGIRLSLNIWDVYSLRREARQFNYYGGLEYIFSSARAVIPLLIFYTMYIKKYITCGLLIFAQVVLFSIDGQKTVIFILAVGMVAYCFYKEYFKSSILLLPAILIIKTIAIIEIFALHTDNLLNFIIRRVMFLPQLLSTYYYDFFTNNPFDLWRSGFMGDLGFDSPYSMHYQFIIGGVYNGSYENNACNGLFGDAFANLGYVGIFIMPIIVIIMLRVYDMVSYGIPQKVIIPSSVLLAINLTNTDIMIMMFTHGFVAMCIVLYFLPRNRFITLRHKEE